MRRPLLAIAAAVLLAPSIVATASTAHASSVPSKDSQITEWSARGKSLRHGHRVRHAHQVHSIRHSAGRGFAWYFANQSRVESNSSCFGSRVVATWYQSGRRTASGTPFNPNGYTAAHRTLPFGSRVSVTNPRNGRSVTVTINDRGPFTRGVMLDLARGAAFAIGMLATQQVCIS